MLDHTTAIANIKSPKTLYEVTFDQIYQQIKLDVDLKQRTTDYQSTKFESEDAKREFKKTFPAFYPTVWLGSEKVNHLTESSLPTGLVQFDIDKKSNPDVDMDEVRANLLLIPELFLLFSSPSLGLKFSIRTDFHRHEGEPIEITKIRFDRAYRIAKDYVLSVIADVRLDDAVDHLKCACFLSHDPNVHYLPNCETLLVDEQCNIEVIQQDQTESESSVKHFVYNGPYSYQIDEVAKLLRYIPRGYSYNERLGINAAVFNTIGAAGIPILLEHWSTDNKEKLKADLIDQERHRLHHNIGYLINSAREFGFPAATTGSARRYKHARLVSRNIDSRQLPGLQVESLDDARLQIQTAITEFFDTKNDTLIKSSVGIGKTEEILEFLLNLESRVNILYLSNNHELLAELSKRMIEQKRSLPLRLKYRSNPDHIMGKTKLCHDKEVIRFFGPIPIPTEHCMKDCFEHWNENCTYINQFENGIGNIRFAASETLFNEPSSFDKRWKPKYIVLDESFLKIESVTVTRDTRWKSLRDILDSCSELKLSEAILKQKDQIVSDHAQMNTELGRCSREWKNKEQYKEDYLARQKIKSDILERIYNYAMTGDERSLHGLRYSDTNNGLLRLSILKEIAPQYKDVPKLILDATADEMVMKEIFPDLYCVSIHASKNEKTRIIQAENFNITKKSLEKDDDRSNLVESLKRIISKNSYSNVGLITYMNVLGKEKFDEWLKDQIGANVSDHFGNIRGTNKFAGCDCLFIVGRHAIDPTSLDDWVCAVYGKGKGEAKRSYADVLVQMTGDKLYAIENQIYEDAHVESIISHLNRSETIQALGRSRWFNEVKTDVYLLSSESLGPDIVIDEWLSWEEFYKKDEVIDPRSRSEKIADTRNKISWDKKEQILLNNDFPDVVDDYKAFMSLGFAQNFSKSKERRSEFMSNNQYELISGVWNFRGRS